MKQVIINISFLLILFFFVGCEKENEFSDFVEGYIVASFRCSGIDLETGQSSGELTNRGFFIKLENQINSIYTFSMQENLFDFPQEILEPNHNVNNCGPTYFNDHQKYKIRFKYKNIKESEKIKFACGPCFSMELTFNWEAYRQVIIKEIIKR